jgi:hypothetical protein
LRVQAETGRQREQIVPLRCVPHIHERAVGGDLRRLRARHGVGHLPHVAGANVDGVDVERRVAGSRREEHGRTVGRPGRCHEPGIRAREQHLDGAGVRVDEHELVPAGVTTLCDEAAAVG